MISGIILIPFTIGLFFLDRAVLVFFPHIEAPKIQQWFDNTIMMGHSLLRVILASILTFLILWMI